MTNNTTKHTPGPWRVHFYGPDDPWIRDSNGEAVIEVGFNQPEREANARLIAAAPEMRALLNDVAETFRRLAAGDMDDFSAQDAETEVRALLARIDGQTLATDPFHPDKDAVDPYGRL